jgi:uncharacterized RDD family membrane protein YckC
MSKVMDENIVGTRISALLIDAILWVPIFVLMSVLSGQTDTTNGISVNLYGAPFIIYLVLGIAYYVSMEAVFGGSVGKLVLGVTVVNESGDKITLKQSFIRNILRFVDAFPYFIPYIVGIVAVAASPTKQRLGDRLAHTYVVKP